VNIYVVVEGRVVEKRVYKSWIPCVNRRLRAVDFIQDVVTDNFFIVSANGFPGYFDVIRQGLEDVSSNKLFDRFVICVDSEEQTRTEKHGEIDTFVRSIGAAGVDYRIVVQHFCFEAWALGNRRAGSRNPKNLTLAGYKKLHDVVRHDPELLPGLPAERLNRSQFAEKYLRLMLNDKNKGLSYSKANPSVVAHPKYFAQVAGRLKDTSHIASFQSFLDAFA
jgi:hypothetical protein